MSAPLILQYLQKMVELAASDFYITVGHTPVVRSDEGLVSLSDSLLTSQDVHEIIDAILTTRQKRDFESHLELNTALDMGQLGRFRLNVYKQKQHPALVIRRIISSIPSFENLKLPSILESLSMETRGLILLTGMTGAGKSTTLAAMVDHRNSNHSGHIITIEDPVEYFHQHKKCVISQREVGVDTESYAVALKNSLRQRPDVILVGEIRDKEVMEQALAAAETGHLCLSTLHTNNAYQAIERIVNFFPEDYSNQVRISLSMNLKAIVSQRLLPTLTGGLVPAVEVMINEGFVRDLILMGDIGKIKDVIGQNRNIGMCTFDQSIMDLYEQGHISEITAINSSDKPSDMKVKLQQKKMEMADEKSRSTDVFHGLDTSLISLKD